MLLQCVEVTQWSPLDGNHVTRSASSQIWAVGLHNIILLTANSPDTSPYVSSRYIAVNPMKWDNLSWQGSRLVVHSYWKTRTPNRVVIGEAKVDIWRGWYWKLTAPSLTWSAHSLMLWNLNILIANSHESVARKEHPATEITSTIVINTSKFVSCSYTQAFDRQITTLENDRLNTDKEQGE